MAKENKNNKQAAAKPAVANQEITTENVMDIVRKTNVAECGNTKIALEEIQQEKDEKKVRELKRIILRASYHRLLAYIQLRARRRENDITLEKLKRAEILEDKVTGFVLSEEKIKKHGGKDGKLVVAGLNGKEDTTYELKEGEEVWVPAVLTPSEYHDEERELNADIRKKMNESDNKLQKEMRELREQYPGYYSYDWDW